MALAVLENARIFALGADLTSSSNKIEFDAQFAEKDAIVFGNNGWKAVLPSLGEVSCMSSGFWQAGSLVTGALVDDSSFANLGTKGPITVYPTDNDTFANSGAAGKLGYFANFQVHEYKLLGQVGDVAPYSLSSTGTSAAVRGVSLQAPNSTVTTTGTGTIEQWTATTATQNLYGCLQMLSVADATATIVVVIQSAATSGFGSPTTRLTFSSMNAIGAQFMSTPGAITDTYFRASWTVTGGTAPSYLFNVAVGAQ